MGNHVFANKTILITGATSGIGRALAIQLAQAGAQLIITGRHLQKLEGLEKTLLAQGETTGGPAPVLLPINFEGATGDDLLTVQKAILQNLGSLDALVHCAVTAGTHAPLNAYQADLWLKVQHVNAQMPVLLTQALLPCLKSSSQPAIIFALDPSADQGQAYWGAYGTSKAAVRCFAKQLQNELENDGVYVRGVDLPATLTPGRRQAFPSQDKAELATPEASAATLVEALAKAW